ncbi:MAG TPA: hypothetical protein H9673_08545 [Candidatus Adamsella sp.]|nr:hypothetical protein [Candidatus Adamsella sp.]
MIDGKKLDNIEKQVESSGKRLGSILDVVKKSLFKNSEFGDIEPNIPQIESESLLSQLESFGDDEIPLFISDANKNIESKYNSISLYFDEIAKLVARLEILIANSPEKDIDVTLLEDIKDVVNNFSANIEALKKIIININFKVVEFEQLNIDGDVKDLIESIKPDVVSFDEEFKKIVDILDEKMKSLLGLIKEFDSKEKPLIPDEKAFNEGINSIISALGEIDTKYNLMLKGISSDSNINFDDLKLNVTSLEKELLIFKDTIDTALQNGNKELKDLISGVNSTLSEVRADVRYTLKNNLKDLDDKMSSLKELNEVSSSDIKNLIEKLSVSVDSIHTGFDERVSDNFEAIDKNNSEIRELLNKLYSSLDTIQENIDNNFKDNLNAQHSDSEETKELINKLYSALDSLKNEFDTTIKDGFNSFSSANKESKEFFSRVDSAIRDIKKDVNSDLKPNIESIENSISDIKTSMNDISSNMGSELADMLFKFDAGLSEFEKNFGSGFNNKVSGMKDAISSIEANLSDVKNSVDEIAPSISYDLKEIISKLNSSMTEFEDNFGVKFSEEISSLKTSIDSISPDKSSIQDVLSNFDKILEEAKESINAALEEKVKLLENEISSFKLSIDSLKQSNSEVISKFDTSFEVLKNELGSNIDERVKTLTDEIAEFKTTLENYKPDNSALEELISGMEATLNGIKSDLGDELDERVKTLTDEIAEFKQSAETLKNNGEDVKFLISDLEKTFSLTSESMDQRVVEEISSLSSKITELGDVFGTDKKEVKELIDRLDTSISEIKNNIDDSNKFEDIYVKIDAVLELLDGLSEESPLELIIAVKESVDDIQKRISTTYEQVPAHSNDEVLALLDEVKSALVDLEENVGLSESDIMLGISEAKDELKEEIKNIDLSSLKNGLSEVKDELKNEIKNIDISSIKSDFSEAKDEIKNEIVSLDAKIENSLSKISSVETQKDLQELKGQVNSIVGDLVSEIVTIFDNISFEEESEEIKDFIYESSEGIRYDVGQIKNAVFEVKNTLRGSSEENTLNEIIEKLNRLSDVQSLIEGVENGIGSVLSFFQSEKYSLTDVEDDFAKIRLAINELSQKTENEEEINNIRESVVDLKYDFQNIAQKFEQLNEDVTNLNMCTNKLILSSEDSTNVLRDNLENFKNMITKSEPDKIQQTLSNMTFAFNDSIKLFDRRFSELKHEMQVFTEHSANNSNSLENIKNSFLVLAEWMESAGKVLEELGEDVVGLKEIDYGKFSQEIDSFHQNNSLFGEKLDAITDSINELKNITNVSDIHDYSSEFEELRISVANMSANILNISSAISESVHAPVEDYSSLLEEIRKNTLELLSKELPNLQAADLKENLEELKNAVSSALSKENSSVQINSDEIAAILEKKVDEVLSSKINENNNRISVLEDKLDSILKQLDTLQKNDTVMLKIKNLESKVENIDTNIQKLVSLMDE